MQECETMRLDPIPSPFLASWKNNMHVNPATPVLPAPVRLRAARRVEVLLDR